MKPLILDKLKICKDTREIAVKSLLITLKKLLKSNKPISEIALRDSWLSEMRKHDQIFPDGWYIPPPHGIEVLFGSDKNLTRVNARSIRPEEFWPKNNVYLDKGKDMISIFAGPVDKRTGVIGDFGMTIYFGKNRDIMHHLKLTFKITHKIAQYAKSGMKLCELADYGNDLMKKHNIFNYLLSPTDPVGTNMGHTIPFSYEEMRSYELKFLESAKENWDKFKEIISKKRKFINKTEQFKIIPETAITIEPRPQVFNRPDIPMVWFHMIVLFKNNGEKELLTNFNDIFKLVGMNYMM